MATEAAIGYGAKFGIHDGEELGGYVDVAEVTSITPPGMTREAIEATHLNSPDKIKEFIAGLAEGGDAQLTLNWVPSETDAVVAAFEDESGEYQITAPNGIRMQFAGIFTAYEFGEVTPDDRMTASATIKQTGKLTLMAAE